jgi:hypothetical protein
MKSVILIFILSSLLLSENSPHLKHASIQTSYENLTLANGEDMGLIGVNYLLHPNDHFYYGLGTYGAVTGDRGGFFTGGFTTGVKYELVKDLYIDAGVFLGGGGGASADGQGGGLMFKAYSGLLVDFGTYSLGANYSYIKFPNGDIDSTQIGFVADMKFTTTLADDKLDLDSLRQYNFKSDEDYLVATYQTYFPKSSTKTRAGVSRTENVDLVGVEYGIHVTPSFVTYFESAGALKGANGYMEVLGGVAYAKKLSKNTEIFTKASLGLGGGGKVDTGGGGISKASLMFSYSPTKRINARIGGGYFHSLNGGFDAPFAEINFGINTNFLSADADKNEIAYTSIYSQKFNMRFVNQTYFYSDTLTTNPAHTDNVQLTGVKLDWFLTDKLYVSGQALAAYAGEAGGYAAGMFGLGYIQPIGLGFNAIAEVDIGAGAGGAIRTGGGAILQPMAGLSYNITNNLAISAMAGKILAINGPLEANVLDVAIVYKFNKLLSK